MKVRCGMKKVGASRVLLDIPCTAYCPDYKRFPGEDIGAQINAAWASGVKKIIMPRGTFSYSTTMAVPAGTASRVQYMLIGGGQNETELTYTATDGTNAIEIVGTDTDNRAHAILRDFTLIGNSSAGQGIKIDLGCRKIELANIEVKTFTNSGKAGVRIMSNVVGVGYTNIISLRDMRIVGNDRGLDISDANIVSVFGGEIAANSTYNLKVDSCRGINFHGTTIQGCKGSDYGTLIHSSSRDSWGLNFFGCWFEETTAPTAVRINASATYKTTGVGFYGGKVASNVEDAENSYAFYINSAGQKSEALISNVRIVAKNSGAGAGRGIYRAGVAARAYTEECEWDCDNDTGGTGIHSQHNRATQYETEEISADGALNTYGISDLDSSGEALALTLGNGTYIGQQKTIVMSAAGNNADVTIAKHETNDNEVARFDAVDEYLLLIWTGTEWATVNNSCTFP